jgi:ABC-type phosphate transport system substrate-binding protein
MTRPRIFPVLVAVLALSAGLVALSASAASTEDYKIIVNPGNPANELERQFVRDAYLRKSNLWGTGTTLRPVDLTSRFAVRDRFLHDVLRKNASQLRSYWNQQIFSGKGVPPPEVDTPASVVAYVLANPGAIGYLPHDADAGGAKVVRVK